MVELAGFKAFVTLVAQHPKIAADCFGAACGAAISVLFAKRRRWEKFLIGFIFAGIAAPAYFEIKGEEPGITTLMLAACLIAIFAYTLLEILMDRENKENAQDIFWELVRKRVGLEKDKTK